MKENQICKIVGSSAENRTHIYCKLNDLTCSHTLLTTCYNRCRKLHSAVRHAWYGSNSNTVKLYSKSPTSVLITLHPYVGLNDGNLPVLNCMTRTHTHTHSQKKSKLTFHVASHVWHSQRIKLDGMSKLMWCTVSMLIRLAVYDSCICRYTRHDISAIYRTELITLFNLLSTRSVAYLTLVAGHTQRLLQHAISYVIYYVWYIIEYILYEEIYYGPR